MVLPIISAFTDVGLGWAADPDEKAGGVPDANVIELGEGGKMSVGGTFREGESGV